MANIKIAQLTNQINIVDTDLIIIESATSTNKMTVGKLKELLGISSGGIVESGSNANGSYVKFGDGTMICRGKFIATLSGDQSKANLYVTYPMAFSNLDVILLLNPYGLNGDQASLELDSINCSGRPVGTEYFQAYIRYLTGTVNYSVNVGYAAIGRWK